MAQAEGDKGIPYVTIERTLICELQPRRYAFKQGSYQIA